MEKMFSSMMAGFMKGMSEDEKKKIMNFGEKMAGMCSCVNWKDMSGEEKKAMAERMMSCCGGTKEMMSTFFKKVGSQPDETNKSEKA
jgi:hypothetical protein